MRTIEQITINGKSYTVTPDEQGYYTVDLSGENLDTFTIDTRSICDSGIELSNLQINEGNTRKDFVLPTASTTESATGIYQSLSDLRLTLTNAERGLRQELNLSVDSIADRIEKNDTNGTKQLQQTIATVDGLRQDIQVVEANASTQLNTLKNTVNGLEQSIERVEANGKSTMASYKQTLDTLQAEFKESQQTVNGATQTKLNNLESTIDGLNQTIQNTIQNVDSVQSVANEAKETAQGLQRQITQIEQSTGKGYLSYTVDVNGAKWNPSDNAKAMGAGQGISAAIYDEVKANGAKFMRIDSDRIYPIASYSDINKTIGVDTSQYSRDFEITTGTHTYEFAPSRNGFPSGSIAQYLIEQTAEGLRSQIKTIEATATNASTQLSEVIRTAEATQSKVTDVEKQVSSNYTQLSNLISQKVSSQDVQSMIQQSEDRIKLQVSQGTPDGESIVSAINLTPDLVRIKGNSIRLDGETIIQDSVIKSSHIESLTADKITAGTIDASKIRVINLDANNINGLESRIVSMRASVLEPLTTGSMRWDLDNNQLTFYSNSSIEFKSNFNALWRDFSVTPNSSVGGNGMETTFLKFANSTSGHSTIVIGTNRNGHSFDTNTWAFTGVRVFGGDDNVNIVADTISTQGGVDEQNGWMIQNVQPPAIYPRYANLTSSIGKENYRVTNIYAQNIQASGFTSVYSPSNRKYYSDFYSPINMHGWSINMAGGQVQNQSDARLKQNIQDYSYNALSRVEKIDFKTFEWKDKPNQTQYGFVAQDVMKFAPEWIDETDDGYLAYDMGRMTLVALRAIQQLLQRIEDLEEELNEIETRTGIYDRSGTRGTDGSIGE